MKKMSAILLSMLLCAAMLVGCSKPKEVTGSGYTLQYDSNLWELVYGEPGYFDFDKILLLPVSSTVFPEQKTDINDPVMRKMEPELRIYEYPIPDGAAALDEHFESFIMNENDMYPDFTFNGLTPVAQRQCDIRNGLGKNDYETCYVCAFNTDEGSIVIRCNYDSDKTWREMQKILNTLEIL